ncbi:unnamed protein product [Leptosia nina]|uniref:Carboxylesterase type B domain-containing protein n=1 Tax=Leptosia nina TaxID=320188 RepID=A0AAV1JN06_9NEOP
MIIALILGLAMCIPICDTKSVLVKLNNSFIVGKHCHTLFDKKPYVGFYNIPYAEPPLKELRFKPPILLVDWLSQKTPYVYYNKETRRSPYFEEDCLYLSIFTPLTSNRKPVLIWLHDYSFWHGPDFFIDEEIVVVTVSFRKGIFGFLNTKDDIAEGNMGAKDIITAIKWLKVNIRFFNGDPERITVAGAGEAGTPVASMLLAPVATNLVSGVILLSGNALSPADYNDKNDLILNKLYNKLGGFKKFNGKDLCELLINVTVDKLLSASRGLFDSSEVRDNQRLINPFGCSLEMASKNPFMKRTPIEMYQRKAVNNVPVLIGYTSLQSLYKLKGLATNRQVLRSIDSNFQYLLPFEGKAEEYNSKKYKEIKKHIMQFYFLNGTIGERSLRRYAKYLTDIEIFPVVRQAVLQSNISSCPVYLYRFAFKGSLNIGWRNFVPNLNWSGATLDDEICYLFKCKSLNHVYTRLDSSERDFIKKFVRLLSNFIRLGNPTPQNKDKILHNLHWISLTKKHSTSTLKALNIGKRIRMRDLPEEDRIALLEAKVKAFSCPNPSTSLIASDYSNRIADSLWQP